MDKAPVLCKMKEYLKTLEAQIIKLEGKKKRIKMLEMNVVPTEETKEDISRSMCRQKCPNC